VATSTLPLRLALSAASGFGLDEVTSFNLPRPATAMLEAIDTGSDPTRTDCFRPTIDHVKAASLLHFPAFYDGAQSLSSMTDSIVRSQSLLTTRTRREFSYPSVQEAHRRLSRANDGAVCRRLCRARQSNDEPRPQGRRSVSCSPAAASTAIRRRAWRKLTRSGATSSLRSSLLSSTRRAVCSASDESKALEQQAKMKQLLDKHVIPDRRMFWAPVKRATTPTSSCCTTSYELTAPPN
jgi:hypothetical protein